MSMKELLIELEVAMTAVLEHSPIVGWQSPEKVKAARARPFSCSHSLEPFPRSPFPGATGQPDDHHAQPQDARLQHPPAQVCVR